MSFVIECWKILCELAPWLLLGMLLSGCLHVLLPPGFVERRLQGKWGVVQAVLLGVPLPLCSCGVIPAGIGLKNQGASNGASLGFLISTPQTGVDSILVSASFFGWPFALFKMIAAGVLGIVGGWLAEEGANEESLDKPTAPGSLPIVDGPPQSVQPDCCEPDNPHRPAANWIQAGFSIWQHGLAIVHSIWAWLLIGILVSAGIETLVPENWFQAIGSWGLLPSMLLVLVASVPLYVCATASVPIAAALVSGGLSPAAALVFLMAGPATNITTMGAIEHRFGLKTLIIYLGTIMIGSMVSAWLFDWLLTAQLGGAVVHGDHDHESWWSVASAVLLLAVMIYFAFQKFPIRRNTE